MQTEKFGPGELSAWISFSLINQEKRRPQERSPQQKKMQMLELPHVVRRRKSANIDLLGPKHYGHSQEANNLKKPSNHQKWRFTFVHVTSIKKSGDTIEGNCTC